MKPGTRPLLLLSRCGMELSWLYAWANFLTISLLERPFPLLDAVAAFALAAVITSLSLGRGWRVILILGLQALGLAFVLSRMVYVFDYGTNPFLSQSWLIDFFNRPRSPLEWIILGFFLSLTLMFWFGGISLGRRSPDYAKICSRFDWGLLCFFVLFLTKLLVRVKGEIEINDPISFPLVCPFLIFGLLAVGLVRNQGDSRREFLPGYRGIGMILSFIFLVLAISTGLVLFFRPYLTMASELGYRILSAGAKPLGSILVGVLRFMYFRSSIRPEESHPPRSGSLRAPGMKGETAGWWSELAEKILAWGLWGLLGLALLVVCTLSAFYLLRWLFSRTGRGEDRQRGKGIFYRWIDRLRAFLLLLRAKVVSGLRGYPGAIQVYIRLLGWGRHSGLAHASSETPREYGVRLGRRFPGLKREIEIIVESFNQEVYGETVLSRQRLNTAKSAWRRLRNPVHWPSRLKAWF